MSDSPPQPVIGAGSDRFILALPQTERTARASTELRGGEDAGSGSESGARGVGVGAPSLQEKGSEGL